MSLIEVIGKRVVNTSIGKHGGWQLSEKSIDDAYEEVHSALFAFMSNPRPSANAVMALLTKLEVIYKAAEAANDRPYMAACLSDRQDLLDHSNLHGIKVNFPSIFPAPPSAIDDNADADDIFSSANTVNDLTIPQDSYDLFDHIAGIDDDTEFGGSVPDGPAPIPFVAPKSSASHQDDPAVDDHLAIPSANIWDPVMPASVLNQHLASTRGWVNAILIERYHIDLLPPCYQRHALVMDSLFILYREWCVATNAMANNRSDLMRVWWATLEDWIGSASTGGVINLELQACLTAGEAGHQEPRPHTHTLTISTGLVDDSIS